MPSKFFIAFFVVAFLTLPCMSWGQSVSLSAAEGATYCEGQTLTLFPEITWFNPFTFILDMGGLASDSSGTDEDWVAGSTFDVASLPTGTYDLTLTVFDGTTTEAASLTIVVLPVVDGSLSLVNQGQDYDELVQTNGTVLFRACAGPIDTELTFDLTFDGFVDYASGMVASLDWGDGSALLDNPAQGMVSHTFAPGSYTMVLTVVNPNPDVAGDCVGTSTYEVFVGDSPNITVTSSGDESCLPGAAHQIEIQGDGSLVDYQISYSDDSEGVSFFIAGDTTVIHTFDQSSCGEVLEEEFFSIENAFQATLIATNACSAFGIPTVVQVLPILVSQGPELAIETDAGLAVCPDEVVTVTDVSTPAVMVTSEGCSDEYVRYWELDPGLTLVSGNLGSPNAATGAAFDPALWDSGDENIEVTATELGVYQATMWVGTPCGEESTSLSIEVLDFGSLTVSSPAQSVCSGEESQTVDFVANPGSYTVFWRVLQENGLPALPGSIEGVEPLLGLGLGEATVPAWTLINEGDETYTFLVEASVPCPAEDPLIHEITVYPQATIELDPSVEVLCSGETFGVDISVNTGEIWEWTSTSDPDVSGASIAGSLNISDELTNSGTTSANVTYNIGLVAPNCPTPGETVSVEVLAGVPSLALSTVEACQGEFVVPDALPSVDGLEWAWENSNEDTGLAMGGQGQVPGWSATNEGLENVTATVTVTGQVASCDPEEAGSFGVTVFPSPQSEPSISSNGHLSCQDSTAFVTLTMLTANTNLEGVSGPGVLGFNDNVIHVNVAGTYTLELTSNAGCNATESVQVLPTDNIAITGSSYFNPACAGEPSGIIEIQTNESDDVTYAWSSSPSTEEVAMDLSAGPHEVVATNLAGCTDTASFVLVDPPPILVELMASLASECGEDNGFLEVLASGGTGTLSYDWDEGSDGPQQDGIDAGEFELHVTDVNGCTLDTTLELTCVDLVPPTPNEFLSPNGDGLNEKWIIDNIDYYSNASIHVYNQWGGEVFQADQPYMNDWEGTNKRGQTLPSATYFYVIDTKKKSQKPFKGFLELTTDKP